MTDTISGVATAFNRRKMNRTLSTTKAVRVENNLDESYFKRHLRHRVSWLSCLRIFGPINHRLARGPMSYRRDGYPL